MNVKKKAVILIIIILCVVTFLALILFNKKENISESENSNIIISNSELVLLKNNDEVFWALQKAINDYYDLLSNKNKTDLLSVLDDDFVLKNGINIDNVLNIIYSNYEDVSFLIKKIYFLEGETITYYFINGYLLNQYIYNEEVKYYGDVNYMIIVNSNKSYRIYPLTDSNFNDFVNNFVFRDNLSINSNFSLKFNEISEKNKLVTYINQYKLLMYVDVDYAYSLLTDNAKNNYLSISDYENNIDNIYNKLSSVIFSFSKDNNDEFVLYNIIDNNNNKIKIYEYNTMDYKIDYLFG